MIPFNIPAVTGKEHIYIAEAAKRGHLSGDGHFTKQCNQWFEEKFGSKKVLLTTSCTHALEMAAILLDLKEGDEVILPSYTFVSTANAFVLRGAKAVFVDIRPDTMNLDENLIEAAINEKTKAIVVVHYAGISCEMDKIMALAEKHNIKVVEDAAQGVMSLYNDKYLGTIGHLGCYSFHETKNYNCGEGGALLINDPALIERAEIIREKGTDRSKFFRGQVDKYSWVDIGSSYLPSELNAAFLYAQLEESDTINNDRLKTWNLYYKHLKTLQEDGLIELGSIPQNCTHNAHMFYIKVKDIAVRGKLLQHLKDNGIGAVFHYVPLHSSVAGLQYGKMSGEDQYTTKESERLIRLPLFFHMEEEKVLAVVEQIFAFYKNSTHTV
ncbi:dTDP-4-amino-4,6-dideoxygalactose transaminase [Paenibacillus wenxiniae]|uniref:dTDP-4-amino-4,6-dideoxygalactose transaminase n=1 Tax=Paenibacillus wenxiniae TaxID=1636843 RepID=A0ABW4RHL2_9BACL